MSTQIGQFTVGAVGLQLQIQVIDVSDSVDFSNVDALTLVITRPDGTDLTATQGATLSVSSIPERIITYVIQSGDLTLAGAYAFKLSIGFSTSETMVQAGSFTVADIPQSGLVVETGAGLSTANSYATVAEGDSYHAGNVYNTTWMETTYDKKAQALMMATRVIDTNMKFRGWRKWGDQALEWPRIRAKNDDAYGAAPWPISLGVYNLTYYDESTVPARLKQATAQVAIELLVSDRTLENANVGVKSIGVGQGAISLTFDQSSNPDTLSTESMRLLSKLGSARYGGGTRRLKRVR